MQTSSAQEETATNEEAIKDVQDAQSNLTQAIQILTDVLCEGSNPGGVQHCEELL